jgi:cytoskeleton protein RodZ
MTEAAAEPALAGVPGVGAELARARESQGLALADVAQRLKFAQRQLEALEQDRFDQLPGSTFVRGMVRNYARLLKLDAEPLLGRMGARLDAPDPGRIAARYSQPVPFSDNARRSTTVYLIASLAVLAGVGALAYQWYQERHAPPRTQMAKAAPKRPEAAPRPAEKPDKQVEKQVEKQAPKQVAEAPVAVEAPKARVEERKTAPVALVEKAPAPAPAEKDKATAAEKAAREKAIVAAPLVAGVHRIVFHCEEEAWLEVQDSNGRQLLSSLNPAGCERVVQGRGPFTLVIGNASHVQVLHNNKPIDLKPHTKLDIARLTLP